jgi:hypothetical protein
MPMISLGPKKAATKYRSNRMAEQGQQQGHWYDGRIRNIIIGVILVLLGLAVKHFWGTKD